MSHRDPEVEIATIEFSAVVGSPLCVFPEDAERAHAKILNAIRQGLKVRLSYRGGELVTPTFLNVAVGQLYGEFTEEQVRDFLLPPTDAAPEDLILLKRVVDTAKAYFRNPEHSRQTAEEVLVDNEA
jgi:hypothetical protein